MIWWIALVIASGDRQLQVLTWAANIEVGHSNLYSGPGQPGIILGFSLN